MVRLFDATFFAGTFLVLAALAVAYAVVTRDEVPLIGTGALALVAVAVIGMAGCAVGGISQAPALGWTNPAIVVGLVLGVIGLAIVGAGLLGWNAVLDPVAQFVPGQAAGLTPIRTATFALAVLIAVKWFVAVGMAVVNR